MYSKLIRSVQLIFKKGLNDSTHHPRGMESRPADGDYILFVFKHFRQYIFCLAV